MKQSKEYVLAILKDHRGDPSSSRWLAFLGFFALVGLIFLGAYHIPAAKSKMVLGLADVLMWLVIACVFAGQASSAANELSKGKAEEGGLSLLPPASTPTPPTSAPPGSSAPPSTANAPAGPPVAPEKPSMGFPMTDPRLN